MALIFLPHPDDHTSFDERFNGAREELRASLWQQFFPWPRSDYAYVFEPKERIVLASIERLDFDLDTCHTVEDIHRAIGEVQSICRRELRIYERSHTEGTSIHGLNIKNTQRRENLIRLMKEAEIFTAEQAFQIVERFSAELPNTPLHRLYLPGLDTQKGKRLFVEACREAGLMIPSAVEAWGQSKDNYLSQETVMWTRFWPCS